MKNRVGESSLAKRNWVIISLHVLIWLMIFLIPYIFNSDPERNSSRHEDAEQNIFLHLNTILNFFWVFLFYFNTVVLIPKFIYKRKILFYVLALLAAFGVAILFDNIFFHVLNIPRHFSIYNSIKHNFLSFLFTVAVSSAYKAITDKTKIEIYTKDKQSEKLKTELSFLRSQMSPHFLLNVMNNLAAMVRLKSDELEPTFMKLSSLMQYMLYETDEEKVVVKNEAEYLQAYIDLQQQRYGDELVLKVWFDVQEDWHTIEPMLLIPFVENAFKHGGQLRHPEINVSLAVNNNDLHFIVKNKFEENESIKDKTSGIGLTNVKRRLELLYPGEHILKIDKQHDWFITDLQITLSP